MRRGDTRRGGHLTESEGQRRPVSFNLRKQNGGGAHILYNTILNASHVSAVVNMARFRSLDSSQGVGSLSLGRSTSALLRLHPVFIIGRNTLLTCKSHHAV